MKRIPKASLFIYRFLYPGHFDYLLSQGMGVRWMPTWFLFKLIKGGKDDKV